MGNQLPVIASLDPNTGSVGWQGSVKINGQGFDEECFVLFDVPGTEVRTNFKSDTLLEADLLQPISANPGTYEVKVHSGEGDVSNPASFTVVA
jgi:hypothetical protein